MNKLTRVMHSSVEEMESAMEGRVGLSEEVEGLMESVRTGRVPI